MYNSIAIYSLWCSTFSVLVLSFNFKEEMPVSFFHFPQYFLVSNFPRICCYCMCFSQAITISFLIVDYVGASFL